MLRGIPEGQTPLLVNVCCEEERRVQSWKIYRKGLTFRSLAVEVFLRGQPPWLVHVYCEKEGRALVLEDMQEGTDI